MNDLTTLNMQLERMIALIELEDTTCGLKHSTEDPGENHQAVDYLCQRLGDRKSKNAHQEIRVPVCQECVEALNDPDWILMYCTYCNKSQWVYRPLAKRGYPEGNQILWLDICPFCVEEDKKE